MKSSRSFLLADSAEHADFLDHFIMDELRAKDGANGSSWSGVFTDGIRYGILWDTPASSLFGQPVTPDNPNGDPSVVVVSEILTESPDGLTSDWYPLPPVAPEILLL